MNQVGNRLFFIVVMLLMDFVGVTILAASNGPPQSGGEVIISAFIGFIFGQVAFALVWSGMLCETWTRSFLQALCLAVGACYLMLLGLGLGAGFKPGPSLNIFFLPMMIPVFGVAGTIPLWIARYLGGWKMEAARVADVSSSALGIEDILHLTAIVASSLMLSRSALSESNTEVFASNEWLTLLASAAFFGLCSAPVTLISVSICGIRKVEYRVARMFFFAAITFGSISLAMIGISRGRVPGEAVGILGIVCAVGFSTLFWGLSALIADGFQLTKWGKPFAKAKEGVMSNHLAKSEPSIHNDQATLSNNDRIGMPDTLNAKSNQLIQHDPFMDEPSEAIERHVPRALDRTLVAGYVAIAILFGLAMASKN